MLENRKEKLLSNKIIQEFLENKINSSYNRNSKFEEIVNSLSYYLSSFVNIKRLLDYVSLIFKYLFDNKLILIIPLNDEGEIWYENIRFSRNLKYQKLEEEINIFFTKFNFSKHFKIKEISSFESSLKKLSNI